MNDVDTDKPTAGAAGAFPYTAEHIAGLFAKHGIKPIQCQMTALEMLVHNERTTFNRCACGIGILLVDKIGWSEITQFNGTNKQLANILGLSETQFRGLMYGFDSRIYVNPYFRIMPQSNLDHESYEVGRSVAKLVGLPTD